MAKFTSGIIFTGSFVHSLIRSFMAMYFMAPLTCPFSFPLAMVFLLMTNVAFSIFLDCLLFHPLLNNMTVRADTDSSVLDTKDHSSQVTIPISSLNATCSHSFQKPSGNMMWNLGATAGGNGKYSWRESEGQIPRYIIMSGLSGTTSGDMESRNCAEQVSSTNVYSW